MNEVPDAPHPELPKRLSWQEFQDRGYLQEVNRRFFHPLGLALALGRRDGEIVDVVVWDGRDDPEGFVFESFTDAEVRRGMQLAGEMVDRKAHRRISLGYEVQPLK